MWGLDWQIWAIIGVAILSLSTISVVIRLVIIICGLHSKDAKLNRTVKRAELRHNNLENGLPGNHDMPNE